MEEAQGTLAAIRGQYRVAVRRVRDLVFPVLTIVPEAAVMVILVFCTAAFSAITVTAAMAKKGGNVSVAGDRAFLGAYLPTCMLVTCFAVWVYLELGDGRFPVMVAAGLVMSAVGVTTSVVLEHLLRRAAGHQPQQDEVDEDDDARRRMVYLHGGVGLAVALAVFAVPVLAPTS